MKCHCHYVFLLRVVFTIVISFSLHAMLPLLANKDEYIIVNTRPGSLVLVLSLHATCIAYSFCISISVFSVF